MITATEIVDYLVPKLQRSGFPIEPETVTCQALLDILKRADILPAKPIPAASQVTDSGDGPQPKASHFMAVKHQLEIICNNAELAPDPRMEGATDCYLVPCDDIETANLILGLLAA